MMLDSVIIIASPIYSIKQKLSLFFSGEGGGGVEIKQMNIHFLIMINFVIKLKVHYPPRKNK